MCNTCGNIAHDDLDDDLSDFTGGDTFRADFDLGAPKTNYDASGDALLSDQLHYEPCKKCRGSGSFIGRNGRPLGPCFACKGKGTIGYKQPANVRAAQREKAAAGNKAKIEAWIAANAEVFGFLVAGCGRGHAISIDLIDSLNRYGTLTERQVSMVNGWIAKSAERNAEAEKIKANAPVVSVAKIEEAFDHARDAGLQRLVLRLDTFKFKPAYAGGKNAGAIYVTEDDEYLGKIAGGKFIRVRACTDDQEARIIAAAADPATAAVAYGKRFGVCSCCGLTLTNALSIELGIGPICRSKWGMA